MKKIAFVFIFFLPCLSFSQHEASKRITADIRSVVVYLDGAEITQSKSVSIPAGRSNIIFEGISPRLNSKSIQVTASENVNILAVSSKNDYLSKPEEKPGIKQVKDSLELISVKVISLEDEKDAFVTEKNMLLKNQEIGGQEKGVPVAELKLASDFYRTKISEINTAISEINKKNKHYNEILNNLNKELAELNAKANYERAEISILVSTNSAVTSNIELRYLVSDAGWAPSYDIKAEELDKPIEITYRAKVFNNTDVDWKNVKMKLSTGDPTQSASQPKLDPWYLNYNTQWNYNYGKGKSLSQIQSMEQSQGYTQKMDINADYLSNRNIFQKGSMEFEEIAVSEMSAEFDIKTEYSVPSDSKPYLVDVVEYKIPAIYKYYSVPKIDRDAFLLARIIDWEDLNLVEGPANIYFGNTYIGQSYIFTRSVSDTLDISLGRDKKVIVTRTKLKEFSSKKLIGSSRKETFAFEIIVKNNRKSMVDIDVVDQLPVSQDSEIEVSALEITKAEKNDLTGELTWKIKLEQDKAQKINLSYSITHPKSKPVETNKYRAKTRAKF